MQPVHARIHRSRPAGAETAGRRSDRDTSGEALIADAESCRRDGIAAKGLPEDWRSHCQNGDEKPHYQHVNAARPPLPTGEYFNLNVSGMTAWPEREFSNSLLRRPGYADFSPCGSGRQWFELNLRNQDRQTTRGSKSYSGSARWREPTGSGAYHSLPPNGLSLVKTRTDGETSLP